MIQSDPDFPTNVAWLDGIPTEWGRIRLRYLIDFLGGGTPSKRDPDFWDGDIPWVSPKDMKRPLIEDTEEHITEQGLRESSTQMVPADSVLLVVRSGILRHSIPVAIAARPVAINQDMKALVPDGRVAPRFLKYTIEGFQHVLLPAWTKEGATVESIEHELLANTFTPVPSTSQQRAIAEFLDKKTAGIDQIVEDKERLIERLEEKRQALIRHAVSRGLDEQRPTRDARLPWLESIPEGWDEVQIRFVARLESGHTPSRSKPEYWAPEKLTVPWVTLADVWQMREARREYIEDTEEMISEDGVANSGARVLPKGTVMLSRTASVGFSGIMARPMATSQDFANWVCGPDLLPEFLLYVFRSMKPEFERLMTGSTHQTIYMPEIRRLMTPLPPREEQEAIVKSLRRRRDPLDSALRDIRTQTDALQEYRTSLITAAVTGQIDVRASTPAVA